MVHLKVAVKVAVVKLFLMSMIAPIGPFSKVYVLFHLSAPLVPIVLSVKYLMAIWLLLASKNLPTQSENVLAYPVLAEEEK